MRARLGQHFLREGPAAETMVRALAIAPRDTIVEIGPGTGALTRLLAAACETAHCRVIAIERDARLARDLRDALPGITLIEEDARTALPALIRRERLRSWKLIGNIPYYLTGQLFRLLGELDPKPAIAVVTVQREVAERLAAAPPRMNILAASVQAWATPRIIQYLAPHDFIPPPRVRSATICLTPRAGEPPAFLPSYYRCIRTLFRQPRKTVFNNLRDSHLSPEDLRMLLKKAGVREKDRPGNLSRAVLINIASRLMEKLVYSKEKPGG